MKELTEQETTGALVSSPGTVTVAGKTYLVDKLNTVRIFTIYEWATEKAAEVYNPFKEVADAIAGLDITPLQKESLLMQAHRVKLAGEIPGEVVTKCLRSKEGVAFQLWVSARNNHPELTYEVCKSMITDDNRLDTYISLDKATGANLVGKAVVAAGFFQQASGLENPGSLATVEAQ